MALLNIFDIAGSALTAQSQRLNVAASNLANADSVTGPDGQPYRAKQVVFQVNAAPGAATGGVKVADVIESRIQSACELLSSTNKTFEEISLQCGYKNVEHFIRQFKKSQNITPAKYRKAHIITQRISPYRSQRS